MSTASLMEVSTMGQYRAREARRSANEVSCYQPETSFTFARTGDDRQDKTRQDKDSFSVLGLSGYHIIDNCEECRHVRPGMDLL